MKGRLLKAENKWLMSYNDSEGLFQFLPLHRDNVDEIQEQEKVFDNIEARISAHPDVEFEIVYWNTGEKFAKLI